MQTILKTKVPERNFDLSNALQWTARARGISQLRLATEIIKANRGRQRLSWKEYFLYGAHQPGLTPEQRAEFLGETVTRAMNLALTPKPNGLGGLFTDKVLTDLVLTRCGLPVAPIRAVASQVRLGGPYPILHGKQELERFLSETELPVFGKPVHGSRSVGAISIMAREGSTLVLGDGTRVDVSTLADEILRHFSASYVFQDLMLPHPELEQIVGPVISSVRVVTLRIDGEVVPLYAAMKMPGKGQMVDDIASFVNTLCSIDHRTGKILRGQDARRLGGTDMATNPVTGYQLVGAQIPHWPEVMQLARDVHEVFSQQGLKCIDVAVTASGPRIIELNGSPQHGFYQKVFARGFWNPEIAPLMTAALADCGHRQATKDLAYP